MDNWTAYGIISPYHQNSNKDAPGRTGGGEREFGAVLINASAHGDMTAGPREGARLPTHFGGVTLATTNNSNQKRRSGRAGAVGRGVLKVLGTLLLIGVMTAAFLACFAAVYIRNVILPNAHVEAQSYSTALASTICRVDENGQEVELQSLYGTENRVWIPYDEIPENLINAAIAIEDKRFYQHHGVDWLRTGAAVLSMMTGDRIQGGSTITQQLLKNMTQYDDVTVKRKILEIFRALDFEKDHSKAEILEMYLNYIYLGQNCYGVSTASEYYFGKDVRELNLAECASLISITNNPSGYNPYRYPENNAYRANLVLDAMLEQGKISQAEHDEASAQIDAGLNFTRGESEETASTILSWHEEQVVEDVIDDLMAEYEYTYEVASRMVYSGGLKIYSSVDPEIQAVVEEVYENRDNLPQTSSRGEQLQSAIVVLDNQGNVVALAGSMGEKEGNQLLNLATQTTRQPGSAMKILAAYAPAIDLGLITPNSTFDDSPVLDLDGPWPSNSYGYYWGLEQVSKAVEQSSNAVAVRVLQELGIEQAVAYLEDHFGFGEISEDDYGLSQLGLGGMTNGVTVLDMAAAYSVFPRDGVYLEPHTYTQVVDSNGKILLDNTDTEPQTAVKATTAWYVNQMLRNVVSSPNGVGTGTEARFSGMSIAGKTGSTNDYRDRWFVGYTPYYTAAVWTGYAQYPERINNGATNPAAQMWRKVMEPIHEGLEDVGFSDAPGELVTVPICMDSGLRATTACTLDPRGSRVKQAYFFASDAPEESCGLHETREVCTVTTTNEAGESSTNYYLAGPYCPREGNEAGVEPTVSEMALLNYVREGVAATRGTRDAGYFWSGVTECPVHTEAAEPTAPSEYDPMTFDPEDPSTYPPADLYPDFDPFDPATWPLDTPSSSPQPSQSPSGGEEPSTDPEEPAESELPSAELPPEAMAG